MCGLWEGVTSIQATWEQLLDWNESCRGRNFSANQVQIARRALAWPTEGEGPVLALGEGSDFLSEVATSRPRSVAWVDLVRSVRRGAVLSPKSGGGEPWRFKSVVPDTRIATMILLCDSSPSMAVYRRILAMTVASCSVISLRARFRGLDILAIAYGREAQVLSPRDLFRHQCSDGARASGAYRLAGTILDRDREARPGPIFVQHFSDGDNWSQRDNEHSVLDALNLLSRITSMDYVEVGEGEAFTTLMASFGQIAHSAFRTWRVTTRTEAAMAGSAQTAY